MASQTDRHRSSFGSQRAAAHARGMSPPTILRPNHHLAPVVSEFEREQQRALFVMQNFVPPNQRGNLNFIMQQLRRSPIPPDFVLRTYSTTSSSSSPLTTNHMDDENSEEWQDLMQWSQPSLLDTLESRPLHLFQWERTHTYLSELQASIAGTITPSPKFYRQRKWICSCMQLLQKNTASLRPDRLPSEVRWVIWKLRRFLATIPTPTTQVARYTLEVRLLKFQVEIGVGPWPKLNALILGENPDHFLMFLTALNLLVTPQLPKPSCNNNNI